MQGERDKSDCKNSRFWHQLNRRIISDLAIFIGHYVCMLLKLLKLDEVVNDRLLHYQNLLVHFIISGLHHLVIDLSSGIPWYGSGAVRFFCMQALGIILEKVVHSLHLSLSGRASPREPPTSWTKILGYIWVISFLSWTVPGWLYPMLCRTRTGMEDSVLPFSLLNNFV